MDYEEEYARQHEEELWLEEQTATVRVNINWKHILKKAQNDSQCKDLSE